LKIRVSVVRFRPRPPITRLSIGLPPETTKVLTLVVFLCLKGYSVGCHVGTGDD
jgi:hypothetical protein